MIFFVMLVWFFFPSYFSSSWRWNLILLIWNFSSFTVSIYYYSFPSSALSCPTDCDKFYFQFLLAQCIFISLEILSLTHSLLWSMLFSFQVFGDFELHGYFLLQMPIRPRWLRVVLGSYVSLLIVWSSWSVNCWGRSVKISNYNCKFVCFSIHCYWSLFTYFAVPLFGA